MSKRRHDKKELEGLRQFKQGAELIHFRHEAEQDHPLMHRQLENLFAIGHGDQKPDTGYMARMMMQAVIPHSPTDKKESGIINGNYKIIIQAGPGEQLPSGSVPRLLLVWVITEAVKTKDRHLILGSSLAEFMEKLDLVPTGGRWGTITRLRTQARRLFMSRVAFIYDEGEDGNYAADPIQFADKVRIFWKPSTTDAMQGDLEGHQIVLSEPFYNQVIERPFPVDMNILRKLTKSPLGIDLYVWLTYRVSYLKQPVSISWKGLHAQFGATYNSNKSGRDNFTRAVKRELKKIKIAWPDLQYDTPRGRLRLFPSQPSISKR